LAKILTNDFLNNYENFPNEMTKLGKFIYYRTYSRYLPEKGRRETWKETVTRAVEYNCSIAQIEEKEAEKLFDNVFHLRTMLSGRTLWVGGASNGLVEDFPIANFNCFRRDTEFLTKEGIKTFYDFEDGDIVEVLNGNGAWSPSVVRNYGKRKLLKLVVQRRGTKYTEDIYVTDNHTWFVQKGNEKRYVEVTTSNLKARDKLRRKVRYENTNLNMCNIGIQHGIVFGDGTFDKKKGHCRISLIGKKQDYVKYFNNATTSTEGDRDSTLVYGLPYYFKDLPPISANVEYIKGFLYGLLMTDGRLGSSVRLGQKDLEVVKQLQSMCEIIGLTTSKIVEVDRTNNNFGDYENTHEFTIHKETLKKHGMLVNKVDEREWIVKEVTETDLLEDVWCVEEPKTNSFTLRGGIHTHNCAFEVIDDFEAFRDLFYLLMIGSGVGFRVLGEDVKKLPKVRTRLELEHKEYEPVPRSERCDNTSLMFNGNTVDIVVGDSKEGWAQALDIYFRMLWDKMYFGVRKIRISYDHVRPKGERLKRFGGTASGHESLLIMFEKIHRVITKAGQREDGERVHLRPIDCLDVANIIGENVVSGGVRRTSEIGLFGAEDIEILQAKGNLYTQHNGIWEVDKEIAHRSMSNNSIIYWERPTMEQLKGQIEQIRFTGEPGFVNGEHAKKRFSKFKGVNPCAEILLDDKGLCNLVSLNVMGFVRNGELQLAELLEGARLNARASLRMTCLELELPKWDKKQRENRLLGCSLTGWQDMKEVTGMTELQEVELLQTLRETIKTEAEAYSSQLGVNAPELRTTIKPEGTQSLMPTVSPGVHASHAPYYIRRVRITAQDPLCKVAEKLGWSVKAEVGQEYDTASTKVIEFPVKSPVTRTKADLTALEQLETYKRMMENYVEHNCSITVTVKDDEWEVVTEWIYENWDSVVCISLLPYAGGNYPLMPLEEITKEEYEQMEKDMLPFEEALIGLYEQELDFEFDSLGCENGVCPIR